MVQRRLLNMMNEASSHSGKFVITHDSFSTSILLQRTFLNLCPCHPFPTPTENKTSTNSTPDIRRFPNKSRKCSHRDMKIFPRLLVLRCKKVNLSHKLSLCWCSQLPQKVFFKREKFFYFVFFQVL